MKLLHLPDLLLAVSIKRCITPNTLVERVDFVEPVFIGQKITIRFVLKVDDNKGIFLPCVGFALNIENH